MAQIGAQYVQAVDPNPVGSLQAFAGANAPTGWLLCDGASVPIASYPELYSVIGFTYTTPAMQGVNFSLPDLRGRMPIGAGVGSGLTQRTLGGTGGSQEIPSHQHHEGDYRAAIGAVNGNAGWLGYESNSVSSRGPGSVTNYTVFGTGFSQSNFGFNHHTRVYGTSSTPVNATSNGNMPPFLVTNYIIKATSSIPRGGTALGSTPPIVTQLPALPQFGEEVDLLSGGVLLRRKWNGSQWVVVASGARQVLNAYSAMTPAERQDIMVNAWANINGLEITLTPVSTSSRFIMEANIHHSGTYVSSFSFSRNGTVVASHGNVNENGAIATSYWNNAVDNAYMITTPLGYVDAPATTSSVTYRVVGTSSWNGETNRIMRINDRGTDMRSISNFSIWEVAS